MSKEYGRMRFAMIMALLVACSTKPNPKSCLDNHCSDPALPFCDVDGSIGGEPNTCIAVECTPSTFEECRGDRALTCNAAGDNYDLVECEFGCGTDGCLSCDTPECEKLIAPKYVPTACTELATLPNFIVDANTTIDTSNELSCSAVVTQPTGPEICLLKYQTIVVNPNHTLTVRGSRALALVADYALDLKGTLDVSADFTMNGAGGGTITSGSTSTTAGGGGAGYRSVGGPGGDSSNDGGAANGGPAGTNPVLLAELLGGRRAARISGTQTPGGAGGAVTLVSCRGQVSVSGLIDAGGGGGASGRDDLAAYFHPAGGGSGGTIVLQGMQVEVTGQIFANGGGGGGGGGISIGGGISAGPGQDAQRSTSPASGGVEDSTGGGAGGFGGTNALPGPGRKSANPGAGGGSAGFILTYTPQFVFPAISGTVSPAFEPNGTVATN